MGCVGFNSKGYLKDRLLPYTNWTLSSKGEGISVLGKYYHINFINFLFPHQENSLGTFFYYIDLDYCINSAAKPYCPQNTSCTSFSGGRYSCVAMEPISQDIVQVVVSLDSGESQGLLALLNSLKHYCSKKLIIHIITNTSDLADIKRIVSCTFPISPKFQV